MTRISIRSGSRAEDSSFRALSDAAEAFAAIGDYRVIGGHMVNIHVRAADLDLPLRGQTGWPSSVTRR
ncbi:hypothetical protein [Planomonospora algeriensis]